ncbi:hypothetical protein GCM10007094_32090 [Pseudovibrio japonicus]|uniref:Uncharacterized protein n=1 Tax=Pseudovibrio japonicus TaxID=366534 RepID=A0ABQ3EM91_9HYPH|nr:hypothetical protein GCM10007094_32090 [Pseudovibrio japonicus]
MGLAEFNIRSRDDSINSINDPRSVQMIQSQRPRGGGGNGPRNVKLFQPIKYFASTLTQWNILRAQGAKPVPTFFMIFIDREFITEVRLQLRIPYFFGSADQAEMKNVMHFMTEVFACTEDSRPIKPFCV